MTHESEKHTRNFRIDPKLDAAGWKLGKAQPGIGPHRTEEEETTNGPADYSLWLDGRIVAVVEAKTLSVSLLHQRRGYLVPRRASSEESIAKSIEET